jgi:hypothetical protein
VSSFENNRTSNWTRRFGRNCFLVYLIKKCSRAILAPKPSDRLPSDIALIEFLWELNQRLHASPMACGAVTDPGTIHKKVPYLTDTFESLLEFGLTRNNSTVSQALWLGRSCTRQGSHMIPSGVEITSLCTTQSWALLY